MDRCPNCNARVDDGAEPCRRCGMGLGLLAATERAALSLLRQAVVRLAAGDQAAAAALLRRSLALHRTPLAEALAGFAGGDERSLTPGPTGSQPAAPRLAGEPSDTGAGRGDAPDWRTAR